MIAAAQDEQLGFEGAGIFAMFALCHLPFAIRHLPEQSKGMAAFLLETPTAH